MVWDTPDGQRAVERHNGPHRVGGEDELTGVDGYATQAAITTDEALITALQGSRFAIIKVTVITSTGTFTTDTKCLYARVRLVGGGGGGGGANTTGLSDIAAAGGGGGGGYAEKTFSRTTLGSSQSVTIGAAGAAGASSGASGGTGGTTSLGSLLSATGGTGGSGQASNGIVLATYGGAGGVGSSGDLNLDGDIGGHGLILDPNSGGGTPLGGYGGRSLLGAGGRGTDTDFGQSAGATGKNYGGGGGGGAGIAGTDAAGGAGAAGVVIVEEYLSA